MKENDNIELALVKVTYHDGRKTEYYALNDKDFDNCVNGSSDSYYLRDPLWRFDTEWIGNVLIPKYYFGEDSEPYIAEKKYEIPNKD